MASAETVCHAKLAQKTEVTELRPDDGKRQFLKIFLTPIASSSFDRAKAVYFAKLAQKTQRYDDMAEEMKKVAKAVAELTVDERILLYVGCKNAIEPRRSSWRILSSRLVEGVANTSRVVEVWGKVEKGADERSTDRMIRELRGKVEAEMSDICGDILCILDQHLIPSSKTAGDPTSGPFYYMMKGDYYKYLAEFKFGIDKMEAVDKAIHAYETAGFIARVILPPTHPLRLGVALNYSVFCYEILGFADSACKVAKEAMDEANCGLDRDSLHVEARQIMETLEDHIIVWEVHQEMQIIQSLDWASTE